MPSTGELVIQITASAYQQMISELESKVTTLNGYAEEYREKKASVGKFYDGDKLDDWLDLIDTNMKKIDNAIQSSEAAIAQLKHILETGTEVVDSLSEVIDNSKRIAESVFS